MTSLSKKELKLVSQLERNEKRYFTIGEARAIFKTKEETYNILRQLRNKKRIVKLNKDKYFLVPIKSYKGEWAEHPFIIIDEIMNGKNYYIAGNSAKYFYGKTEQLPMVIEVRTTKKQGKKEVFGVKIKFLRTGRIKSTAYTKKIIQGHRFSIIKKELI